MFIWELVHLLSIFFEPLYPNSRKVRETKKTLSLPEKMEAIQRNFGGYFGDLEPAREVLGKLQDAEMLQQDLISTKDLILKALEVPENPTETRYLLLLTKNNAALRIIEEHDLIEAHHSVIYGSSFPHDQEYTQICSNINRIKIAMEMGQTVILSNLDNLYESLYDALNQNYMSIGDNRYVDLGLGTHRVKCRVHPNFRMIVVAEDKDVWEKFPIPLINRLEKHYLGMETLLSPAQNDLVQKLKQWIDSFSQVKFQQHERKQQFVAQDVFIGFHSDALASLVLRVSKYLESDNDVIEAAKKLLLNVAAPDAIARLSETNLDGKETEEICGLYYKSHFATLADSIRACAFENKQTSDIEIPMLFITTQSRLLTKEGKDSLENSLRIPVKILPLQQMNTEKQFQDKVKEFLTTKGPKVLLVQAQLLNQDEGSLIDCARFVIQNQISGNISNSDNQNCCIAIVLQTPRIRGGGTFVGLPGHPWQAFHVDELRGDPNKLVIQNLRGKSLADIIDLKLVDMDQLMEEAIPKAVSLTQSERVKRRLEILLNDDSSIKEPLKVYF